MPLCSPMKRLSFFKFNLHILFAMKNKSLVIFIHVVAWLLFLSLPTLLRPDMHGRPKPDWLTDLMHVTRLTNSLLFIGIFYLTYYWLIPRLYLTKKYWAFGGVMLLAFALFCGLNYVLRATHFHHHTPLRLKDVVGPPHNVFMFIIVLMFAFALFLYNQWQKTKEAHLNTEISFLKAQINPHFLFNTLNSIYSLAIVKSERTPEAVVKLSSLMRYSITEANRAMVALGKEIDYINDYISLQQLRLTAKVKLSYNVNGAPLGKEIAPFLLIPFIENAFKHGVNSEEDSDIKILIHISDEELLLKVSNRKVYVHADKNTGVGLGIVNTAQRLTLLYPGRHHLKIEDGDDDYFVSLQIAFR